MNLKSLITGLIFSTISVVGFAQDSNRAHLYNPYEDVIINKESTLEEITSDTCDFMEEIFLFEQTYNDYLNKDRDNAIKTSKTILENVKENFVKKENYTREDILSLFKNIYFELKKPMPNAKEQTYFLTPSYSGKDSVSDCSIGLPEYLYVGKKLELPIYFVEAPNHLFIRYDDGKLKVNFETTAGESLDNQFYEEFFGRKLDNKYYLKNISPEKYLSVLYIALGNFKQLEGKWEYALACAKKANEINPNSMNPYFLMFNSYKVAAVKDLKKNKMFLDEEHEFYVDIMIKIANWMEKEDPLDFRVQNMLGNAYGLKQENRLSKKHFLKAVKLNSQDLSTYYNLGLIFVDEKNYPEADKYIKGLERFNSQESLEKAESLKEYKLNKMSD